MTSLTRILFISLIFSWINISGQENNVLTFRQFAESYLPKSDSNNLGARLPAVSDKIKSSLLSLRQQNSKELEKYLTLIFVKLYRSHMECCHQSYEIRTSKKANIDSIADPLVYEFNLITKIYNADQFIEFIPSSIGYEWTEKNPKLLKYSAIKKEYNIIKQIKLNIDKGVYFDKKK